MRVYELLGVEEAGAAYSPAAKPEWPQERSLDTI
jgi:hypothetical protein